MKRGCLISLLILGACFGGYWYVLHGHIEPPVFWWATGIASFFMFISVSTLRTAIGAARGATIASGVYETWTYQVVRRGEDWRISNERWETKLSGNEP
jgi:hypothetical protein